MSSFWKTIQELLKLFTDAVIVIQCYPMFAELTASIKLQQQDQSYSLEDLLHRPVAKVQKNSLTDLLKYTPEKHSDYSDLKESHVMIQTFPDDFNKVNILLINRNMRNNNEEDTKGVTKKQVKDSL